MNWQGKTILAPLTKGGNLPFRRLCVDFGAGITTSEMAYARQVNRRSRAELALLRKHPSEECFGVQWAASKAQDAISAGQRAIDQGACFIDLNCGCPIHDVVKRGMGATLLQRPAALGRLVEAMVEGLSVPVTVKIRSGWKEAKNNASQVAQLIEEAGAAAITIHPRSRQQRYSKAADWGLVRQLVEERAIPVIGNGDILTYYEADRMQRDSGCASVMVARGALIKPWIFKEAVDGAYWDISAAERVALGRRYVALAREHWGEDERGLASVRRFLLWHLDFWYRYVPRYPDGRFPKLQERGDPFEPRSELEAVLSRPDPAAHGWIADLLIHGEERAGPIPQLPSEEDLERHRDPIPQG